MAAPGTKVPLADALSSQEPEQIVLVASRSSGRTCAILGAAEGGPHRLPRKTVHVVAANPLYAAVTAPGDRPGAEAEVAPTACSPPTSVGTR